MWDAGDLFAIGRIDQEYILRRAEGQQRAVRAERQRRGLLFEQGRYRAEVSILISPDLDPAGRVCGGQQRTRQVEGDPGVFPCCLNFKTPAVAIQADNFYFVFCAERQELFAGCEGDCLRIVMLRVFYQFRARGVPDLYVLVRVAGDELLPAG